MSYLEQARRQPRSPRENRRIGLLLYVAGKEDPHGSVLQAKDHGAVVGAERGVAVCIDKVRGRMQDQPGDTVQARQAVAGRDPVIVYAPLGDELLQTPRRPRVIDLSAVEKVIDFHILQ